MYYSHKVVYISDNNAVGETLCQNEKLATVCEAKLLLEGFTTAIVRLEGKVCLS